MNMNLKMFCILCLCIILCDTSKASENLTFVLKQSLILSSVFVVIIICCLGAMNIKDCGTNYIRFISFDVPEEMNVSFDLPEVNDDAVGRSRYERFYSVRSNLCERKSKSSKTFARVQSSGMPLKELSRVKLRRLS